MSEFALEDIATDSISSIKFPNERSTLLLASSWDASVRLYDVETRRMKTMYQHKASVLDCCFSDTVHCYSGGLDQNLIMYDLNAEKETLVGSHQDAIRCVHHSAEMNLIITGSWDCQVKLWDPRSSKCVGTYQQPDKVYSLDSCGEKLVVATHKRLIAIWNLNSMNKCETKESYLKYQTRVVRCFPNRQGFVVGSIEGRVAVEYFDMDAESQKKKYAFKCHRNKQDKMEVIYPVNAIAFHNVYNTFATGGSDGIVNIWDGFNKKRLCQFHSYPNGITSLCFDQTGMYLAIASSYNYEEGSSKANVTNSIFVRRVSDLETKPK